MAVNTAPEQFYIHPQTGEKISLGVAAPESAEEQKVVAVKAGLAAKIAEIEAFAKEEELKLRDAVEKLVDDTPPVAGEVATPSIIEEEVAKIETAIEGVYEKVKGAFVGPKSAAK